MREHAWGRRLFALALSLCLLAPVAPQAQALSVGNEEEITPYYIGTFTVSATISPYIGNTVECWGHVDCYPGYTADAVMRLQWLDVDGVWMNYMNWYAEGRHADFYELYSVPSGQRYRVRVVADIFDDSTGEVVEVVGATSGSFVV